MTPSSFNETNSAQSSHLAASRYPVADLLRAAAILYIVGFWHLSSYSSSLTLCNNRFTRLLTTCVLGLFVFLSGLLLSSRYQFVEPSHAWSFWRRRFFRTYPLYFMALTAFYLFGLIDLKPYALSALLLNMVVNEELVTLWFATMIMVFYGLTPLLLVRYSTTTTLLRVAALVLVFVGVHVRWGLLDLALPKYLPVFGCGLVVARSTTVRRLFQSPVAAIAGALIFVLVLGLESLVRHNVARLLLTHFVMLCSLPLFLVAGQLCERIATRPVVSVLSRGSYALYLVHRVAFLLALKLFFPATTLGFLLYFGGLVLPLTILVSCGLQWGYDRLLGWQQS